MSAGGRGWWPCSRARKLQEQLHRRGAQKVEIQTASEVLNPEALTIGFARALCHLQAWRPDLRDPTAWPGILNDPRSRCRSSLPGRPIPRTNWERGDQRTSSTCRRQPEFRHRLVFIEDYDMTVAVLSRSGIRCLVNNPLRPLEACGTSGMKAAANGAVNMSVLDGWWAKGISPAWDGPSVGGRIRDPAYQDQMESESIYDLLEKIVVPLFYERGRDNLPREWIGMMKKSMQTRQPALTPIGTPTTSIAFTFPQRMPGIRFSRIILTESASCPPGLTV